MITVTHLDSNLCFINLYFHASQSIHVSKMKNLTKPKHLAMLSQILIDSAHFFYPNITQCSGPSRARSHTRCSPRPSAAGAPPAAPWRRSAHTSWRRWGLQNQLPRPAGKMYGTKNGNVGKRFHKKVWRLTNHVWLFLWHVCGHLVSSNFTVTIKHDQTIIKVLASKDVAPN